jgi:hypothetical protein
VKEGKLVFKLRYWKGRRQQGINCGIVGILNAFAEQVSGIGRS